MNLPSLSVGQKDFLNALITKEELIRAITNLQSGKEPGPDGFGSDFDQKFIGLLMEPMLQMFYHSFLTEELQQTLREANISLILKKGKHPESFS